jgi:hypothetical protein
MVQLFQHHGDRGAADIQIALGRGAAEDEDRLDPVDVSMAATMAWVVRSVSSSVDPGGSSTETEMRLTSSGGMKLPGTCSMKKTDTNSTPMALIMVR